MLELQVELTNHGKARMDERLNIKSLKKERRMASLAFQRGKILEVDEEGIMKILFNDNLFIFSSKGALITVYHNHSQQPWKNRRYLFEKSFKEDLRRSRWEEEM